MELRNVSFMLRWVKKRNHVVDVNEITKWILPFHRKGHWATLLVDTVERILTVIDQMHITGTTGHRTMLNKVIAFVRRARGNAAIISQPRVCILLRRYTQIKINASV